MKERRAASGRALAERGTRGGACGPAPSGAHLPKWRSVGFRFRVVRAGRD